MEQIEKTQECTEQIKRYSKTIRICDQCQAKNNNYLDMTNDK